MYPRCEARDASVDARVAGKGTLFSPRAYADDNVVVQQRATRITLALIPTSHVDPTRAQHVVGDLFPKFVVAILANTLVY